MEKNELEIRKEKVFKFLKDKKDWIQYILLAFILWLAYYIRSQNWNLLKDVTTGKYISLELDSTLWLRYAQYIADHGKLYAVDMMRNLPLGAPIDFGVYTAYFVAYLYKFLHIFIPSMTVEFADIIYPTIAIIIATIFLFLLVRRLFDYRVALLSSLLLVTSTGFLYRSITSDHDILGLMFIFMTLYFFVAGWQSKKIKSNVIFGALAAFSTVLAFNTAGDIRIFIMVLVLFIILHIFLDSVKKSDLYVFPIWYLLSFPLIIFTMNYSAKSFLLDYTMGLPATFAFFSLILYYLLDVNYFKKLKIYNKLLEKMPKGLIVLISIGVIGSLFMILLSGLTNFISMINGFIALFSGDVLSLTRWATTVAEGKKAFVSDWLSNFGTIMFCLFIAGLVILVYKWTKPLKDNKNLFYVFTVSILAFIFSRYSQNSVLNGDSSISKILFYGSILIFGGYTLYYYFSNYYSSRKVGKEFIIDLDWKYTLVLMLVLVNVVGGTTAIRLLFELTPFLIIVAAFTLIFVLDYILTLEAKVLRYGGILLLVLLLFSPFSFSQGIVYTDTINSFNSVKYSGPGYNQQWQYAGKWVRENIPSDAIFDHWWDYGYWVQSGLQRPTIVDGGNRLGWWNFLNARYVLTTSTDVDALRFLYAHNVSYLLIVNDEIGKYPAYALIGSDANLDRYSYINFMGLDNSLSKETRNGTLLVYTGGYPLDEDLVYNGKVIPRGTPVAGTLIQITNIFNSTGGVVGTKFEQPRIILQGPTGQLQLSLKCIYMDKEYNFANYDYGGCVRILPYIQGNQANPLGSLVFMSRRVTSSLFGRLYLLEQNNKYFTQVYTDVNSIPMALYNGRSIGPIKIWKVNYPKEFSINNTDYDYFTRTSYPDVSLIH